MENFNQLLSQISDFMWGVPMLILLIGTHIFLTIKLRVPQRHIFKAIKLSVKKDKGDGDISPFASLMTALSSTIGTGNIIGIATAVSLGGAGAVFWCWIVGVLGIATKYAEGLLAVEYRIKTSDGTMIGGPMYALERGLNMKWLGVLFAIFTIISSFGIGNTVQANSAAVLLSEDLGISPYISGAVMAFIVMLVIVFGIKGIARASVAIIPFAAGLYIIYCVMALVLNFDVLGETFQVIWDSAFAMESVGGGLLGGGMMLAMRYGAARGVFSNESGLGSAPIIAAAARTTNPVKQALISSSGTFWDTVIVCALTGLVVVSSIIAHPDIDYSDGALLTREAFSKLPLGNEILAISLLLFAFSTILGWSYYGEKSIEYLGSKRLIIYYRMVWVVAVFFGSVASLDMVWDFADISNALMIIPNVVSLLLLSGVMLRITRAYK